MLATALFAGPPGRPQAPEVRLRWTLPSPLLDENSGMVLARGKLIFINDSKNEARVYVWDTLQGQLVHSCAILKVANVDWEDLAADDRYLYIGDFGNNAGVRQNLSIVRVELDCVFKKEACPGAYIRFECTDQKEFYARPYQHNYDFEALAVWDDSLLVFSKNWLDGQTRLYVLPKQPGTYRVGPRVALPSRGLVTGATYHEDLKLLALCGYQPRDMAPEIFLLVWPDFSLQSLKRPAFRRLSITPPQASQIESLVALDGHRFWMARERSGKKKTPVGPAVFEVLIP
ncbi:MAG: hypothetical protein N2050_08155 [Flavobacteriales bacterium]|nr:hypothetical protein [Flavobacteriales bacterium]MCX7650509.1 hypothetical protein [Flavobacteriales bacterium]MDW8432612.1 hypothetical protein [Flavobacteriales bacterium]